MDSIFVGSAFNIPSEIRWPKYFTEELQNEHLDNSTKKTLSLQEIEHIREMMFMLVQTRTIDQYIIKENNDTYEGRVEICDS